MLCAVSSAPSLVGIARVKQLAPEDAVAVERADTQSVSPLVPNFFFYTV